MAWRRGDSLRVIEAKPGCARDGAPPTLLTVTVRSVDSPPYPCEREVGAVLRDGSTIHVRPVRASDEPAIREFLERVSPDSIALRFFGAPDLDWVVSWSVDVDYADRFALVAESDEPRRIIAHAAYVRESADRAEVAFLVADAWQEHGISTILLSQLAEVAVQHGISTFTAQVLPTNHLMIEVFRDRGSPLEMHSRPGVIEVELPTAPSCDDRHTDAVDATFLELEQQDEGALMHIGG